MHPGWLRRVVVAVLTLAMAWHGVAMGASPSHGTAAPAAPCHAMTMAGAASMHAPAVADRSAADETSASAAARHAGHGATGAACCAIGAPPALTSPLRPAIATLRVAQATSIPDVSFVTGGPLRPPRSALD